MNVVDMAFDQVQEDCEFADIEDELNNLMANLLSERRNEPFLRALFSAKPGKWVEISALCKDLGLIQHRLDLLQAMANDSLFVTWLEYPDAMNSEGFCIIAFFAPMVMWSQTAIYNKTLLLGSHHRNGVNY